MTTQVRVGGNGSDTNSLSPQMAALATTVAAAKKIPKAKKTSEKKQVCQCFQLISYKKLDRFR